MKIYVDKNALQDYTTKLIAKEKTIFATKNEVGSPLVASTVAGMTDHEKIYVYVGSETGYTSGNWYYWDGSAWVSGGIYNSEGFVLDDTLTSATLPAQAKAVGDKVNLLSEDVVKINNGVVYNKNASSEYTVPFEIEAGKTYKLTNVSASGEMTMYTRTTAAGSNVDTVTSQLGGGKILYWTAEHDAAYLYGFINVAGGFTFEDIESDIYNLKKADYILNENLAGTVNDIGTAVYQQTLKSATSTTNDYELGLDGLSSSNSSYKLLKYAVTAGVAYRVVSDYRWQFQNSATVPSSGRPNLIGYTRGVFDGIIVVPTGVTHIIICTAKNSGLGKLYTLSEKITGIETTVNNLSEAVCIPDIFQYDSSGTKTAMINLEVGKTYIIQNMLDSLSNVTANAYNGSTKTETIASPLNIGTIVEFSPQSAADRISFYCSSSGAKISVTEMGKIYDEVYSVKTPIVQFRYDTDLKDISAENDKMDWSNAGTYTVLEQVYTLFDALVTNYSSYVSRVDAAVELSLEYPEYANGVETAGDYMVTPAYKTYMYKLIDSNAYAGNGSGGNCQKKKILILGCEHGNEIASAFNCYLLANELCKCTEPDIFALRAGYDIYFVPCLDGYGMYHRIRGNGNLVNINRNYPVFGWVKAGENTKSDQVDALNQYTGPSAGSEFETKIVMGLFNSLKPDVVIDHHNYGNEQNWQFYTETVEKDMANPLYNALVDCSKKFKAKLPQYFGAGYGLVVNDTGSAPGSIPNIGAISGTSYRWMRQQGHKASLVCEISNDINFLNGTHTTTPQDKFGDTTFSIALFTLENVLKHICEYESKLH